VTEHALNLPVVPRIVNALVKLVVGEIRVSQMRDNFFLHRDQAGKEIFLIRKNFLAIKITVAMLRVAFGESIGK